MVCTEEARSSQYLFGIIYCMLEFKYLCKISIVNCSNGARRIQDICLVIRTCKWSYIKICSIKDANFSKEWTCLGHL